MVDSAEESSVQEKDKQLLIQRLSQLKSNLGPVNN